MVQRINNDVLEGTSPNIVGTQKCSLECCLIVPDVFYWKATLVKIQTVEGN